MDVNNYLFRGASGIQSKSIISNVGIGPIYKIIEKLYNENLSLSSDVFHWLKERYLDELEKYRKTEITSFIWKNQKKILDYFVNETGEILTTPLAILEHIYGEETIQYPCAARALYSASLSYETAILYAYGVNPESASLQPYNNTIGYNTNAFVALIRKEYNDKIVNISEQSVFGKNGVNITKTVKHRIKRDQEVLINDVRDCCKIIDLSNVHSGNIEQAIRNAKLLFQ